MSEMNKEFLRKFMSRLVKTYKKNKEIEIEKRGLFIKRSFGPAKSKLTSPLSRISPPPSKPSIQSVSPQPEKTKVKETKEEKTTLDLGKINSFLEDSSVNYIECSGPDKKVKIKKEGITSETEVTLTKEEIGEVIKKFGEKAGVPAAEMFKAEINGLKINAINSPFIGSRFVIIKG